MAIGYRMSSPRSSSGSNCWWRGIIGCFRGGVMRHGEFRGIGGGKKGKKRG